MSASGRGHRIGHFSKMQVLADRPLRQVCRLLDPVYFVSMSVLVRSVLPATLLGSCSLPTGEARCAVMVSTWRRRVRRRAAFEVPRMNRIQPRRR